MKTILVFPPVWECSTPYSSLAVLSAFLKRNNIDVDVQDLNIETQYFMLTDLTYIKDTINILKEQEKTVKNVNHIDVVRLALFLYEQYKHDIEENVIKKIQLAKTPREEMHYRIVSNYLRYIVSAPYYPTAFSDLSYTPEMKINSITNLFHEVNNIEKNIFYTVFENKFLSKYLNYDIIGISIASTNQLVPAFSLAKLIKKYNSCIKIIIGGAILPYIEKHIHNNKEFFEYADCFIVGEGETALLNCIKYFQGKISLNKIQNTIYIKEGQIFSNNMNYIEDINKLPVPDYTKYPLDKYFSSNISIPYLTSRGCYWNKCSFCSLTCNYANKYRERSIELVEDDLVELTNQVSFDRLVFNDETLSSKRIDEIADILIKHKLIIKWNCLGRLNNTYSDEILKKAKEAGLLMLSLGLESGSQKTLNHMSKGIYINEIPNIIHKLRMYDIWVNLYYIIGFPTETQKDFEESLDFLLNLEDNIDSLSYTIFRLEANSKIFKEPNLYNISYIQDKDSKDFFGPDYDYKTLSYNSTELNERYNEFYDIIDNKVYNPHNIYYDFDSIFSFLCNDKRALLKKEIVRNVEFKKYIASLANKNFESVRIELNKNTVFFRGNNINIVLISTSNELYSFNATSIHILDLIKNGITTFYDIVDKMQAEYAVDNDLLCRDMRIILKRMAYLEVIKLREV